MGEESGATEMTPVLGLTGERTLPGIPHENYWFRRHEAAYLFARHWIRGAIVAEAGSGEGYGADIMASAARRVVALDYDADAVSHTALSYPTLHSVRANLVALPLADSSVDALTSFQVVEHLWDQPRFVSECARALRPAGTLLITTPNRITFSPGLETPVNPFHTRELSAGELTELLDPLFRITRMYGVHHGRRLKSLDRRWDGSLISAQLNTPVAAWPPRLVRDVAGVTAKDFVLTESDVDTSLDLYAIAVKRP